MIKESFGSLETKLGKRKEFLFDNDLDKLQKEFLANKEKCSVKIIKKAPNKKENEINTNNLIFPTGEIKKKKGKKKVKDVISLNLPPLINDNEINNKNQNKSENVSLFSLNYNKIEEKNKANDTNNNPININITTGLPEKFKIEEIVKESNIKSEKDNNILIKENEKNEIKEEIPDFLRGEEDKINNDYIPDFLKGEEDKINNDNDRETQSKNNQEQKNDENKIDNLFNKRKDINNLFNANNNLFADERNDENEENINKEDDKAFNNLFNSKNNVNKNTFNNNSNNIKQNDDEVEDVFDELLL